MTAELHPDRRACAAWQQAAVPLVRMPPPEPPERLVAPPREHKPTPSCAEGGPHDYPPGSARAICTTCGVGAAANAIAGLRHAEREHRLSEAFG